MQIGAKSRRESWKLREQTQRLKKLKKGKNLNNKCSTDAREVLKIKRTMCMTGPKKFNGRFQHLTRTFIIKKVSPRLKMSSQADWLGTTTWDFWPNRNWNRFVIQSSLQILTILTWAYLQTSAWQSKLAIGIHGLFPKSTDADYLPSQKCLQMEVPCGCCNRSALLAKGEELYYLHCNLTLSLLGITSAYLFFEREISLRIAAGIFLTMDSHQPCKKPSTNGNHEKKENC